MKKIISLSVIALVLTISPVKRSNAIVGGFMVNPGIMLSGVIAGSAGLAASETIPRSQSFFKSLFDSLFWTGFITLDGENGDFTFKAIQVEDAKKFNISKQEQSIYNAELHELNLIKDEVAGEFSKAKIQNFETSKKIWDKYRDLLSPETLTAVEKLLTHKK